MTVGSESTAPRSSGAGCLWPVIAGLLAFLGSLVLGIALTVLVIRAIPPQVPNPTEAYEGFGDAMMAMLLFELGAGVSLMVAVLIGLAVAAWIWGRTEPVAPTNGGRGPHW
jgi:hypothetical protein